MTANANGAAEAEIPDFDDDDGDSGDGEDAAAESFRCSAGGYCSCGVGKRRNPVSSALYTGKRQLASLTLLATALASTTRAVREFARTSAAASG